ncbi:MAG: hypothetical protein DHS20C15_23120 [Planctomycetota bacterium]|nr:MAG: hypothetical protein DHS20C15_23120 [Planctomycetota bacterium]
MASFLCSLFEAALYSITPSQLGVLRASGRPGAERLAHLRADVESPIAAILTVNTVAHTVGAAWCGALVSELYGSEALGVFAALFTVAVLLVTEIVPKSLGVRYATTLAPKIVWPLQLMIWSTWPVVWLARHAMRWLSGGDAGGPSEDEIVVLSKLAAQGGAVRREEHRWVTNALALDQLSAAELRTPRTVVEVFDAETTVSEAVAMGAAWVHSRVPLVEHGDPDKLLGLVLRRDVFEAALRSTDAELRLVDLARPLPVVPGSKRGHELLRQFIEERTHLLAVVDEYGGFEGVVTLEDVLERLLGKQIVDEHDEVHDMQTLALERARRRARPDSGAGEDNGDEAASRGDASP